MRRDTAVPYLRTRLADTAELGMVRHESAESLGCIATSECLDILKTFLNDPERVVRESCEVGLDIGTMEKPDV